MLGVSFLLATSVVDGISFTVKPSTVKHGKGSQYVYQVRVVTGESSAKRQGKQTTRKDGRASARKVDSLVDNDKTPTKYVVFSNDQAYPEYLITWF